MYVCSLVDGDVFESVGKVVPFNVIVGHSALVSCASGEVVGRFRPELSEAVSCAGTARRHLYLYLLDKCEV